MIYAQVCTCSSSASTKYPHDAEDCSLLSSARAAVDGFLEELRNEFLDTDEEQLDVAVADVEEEEDDDK